MESAPQTPNKIHGPQSCQRAPNHDPKGPKGTAEIPESCQNLRGLHGVIMGLPWRYAGAALGPLVHFADLFHTGGLNFKDTFIWGMVMPMIEWR